MSERCYICIETKKNEYVGVYCHNNGEVYNTGELLLKNYNSRIRVEELLSYGDMSILGENIETSVFYKRDKGEYNHDLSAKAVTLLDINSIESLIRYCYIFSLDDTWQYFICGGKNINLLDLNDVIFIE